MTDEDVSSLNHQNGKSNEPKIFHMARFKSANYRLHVWKAVGAFNVTVEGGADITLK